MAKVSDLHQKWMKNKEYRKAHEELASELALARALIEACDGGPHAGAACATHGDHAIGHSAA